MSQAGGRSLSSWLVSHGTHVTLFVIDKSFSAHNFLLRPRVCVSWPRRTTLNNNTLCVTSAHVHTLRSRPDTASTAWSVCATKHCTCFRPRLTLGTLWLRSLCKNISLVLVNFLADSLTFIVHPQFHGACAGPTSVQHTFSRLRQTFEIFFTLFGYIKGTRVRCRSLPSRHQSSARPQAASQGAMPARKSFV
jgi:hypothetical protein